MKFHWDHSLGGAAIYARCKKICDFRQLTRKLYKIHTQFLWKFNRKSYARYRMATLNDSNNTKLPLFWATVCKTVRPVLSVRCLSVCDVGVLWPNYGWMDEDETWHGGRPRPRSHCVRWGPSSLLPKGAQPPIFGPCLLWPNGCPSQLLRRFLDPPSWSLERLISWTLQLTYTQYAISSKFISLEITDYPSNRCSQGRVSHF